MTGFPHKISAVIFDADDVLLDQDVSFLNFLRTQPGFEDLAYDDFFGRFPAECFAKGSFEIGPARDMVPESYKDSPFFLDRPPYPDAVEVLEMLRARGIKMFILSAAIPSFVDGKKAWLEGIFPGLFDDICISLDGGDKLEFLRGILTGHNLNPAETAFIDDRFGNLSDGLALGLTVVHKLPALGLPLPPDLRAKGVRTVKSLTEFAEIILAPAA